MQFRRLNCGGINVVNVVKYVCTHDLDSFFVIATLWNNEIRVLFGRFNKF